MPSVTCVCHTAAGGWGALVDELEACVQALAETTSGYVAAQQPWRANIVFNIVFADNTFLQDLNNRFRGKDAPTNVLAFPDGTDWGDGCQNMGDVFLAHETTVREAGAAGRAHRDHIAHLCVHGMLHLWGYDHVEPTEAEEMEAAEIEILAVHGIANPYAMAGASGCGGQHAGV